jgi:hypothetical protein
MSTVSADRLRTRAAVLAALVVVAHAGVVLIGWAAGWSLFLVPSPSFIPMAPTTALAFLALSLALGARLLAPEGSPLRSAGAVLAWIVATLALVNLAAPSLLDQLLGGDTGQFGRVRLGVMSPVTAAAIIPLALAIAATGARSHYVGALATIAAIVGATVALGYAYGTPLLYGGGTIPVALPTGLSLLVLGVAAVLAAGPDVWPLDRLVGDEPRPRMLRAFLPDRLARRAAGRAVRWRPGVDRNVVRGDRRGARRPARLAVVAAHRESNRAGQSRETTRRAALQPGF